MALRDRLAALLAEHQASDPLEEAHLDRMRALAGEQGDPFDRKRPEHFTASGFVVDGPRLLLVFHTGMQRWLQPGGHIEACDAAPEDAARREVAEETGLAGLELLREGVLDVDVHSVDHGGVLHEHFDLRFLFGAGRGAPAPGDGVSAVRWASFDDLESLGADASILRAARRALAGAS
jgi:8-oxo-dGTP pyrophosphatase MutT (NUDIX family)